MLKGILSRLTYANVVASIALFVALGGGYAVAFSGSGTLQKARFVDFSNPQTNFTTVRTLTGIGSLQARCTNPATNPNVELRVRNDTNKAFNFAFHDEGNGTVTGPGGMDGGSPSGTFQVDDDEDYIHLYIHPFADAKRPQADIDITTSEGELTCESSSVTVLALNTEE